MSDPVTTPNTSGKRFPLLNFKNEFCSLLMKRLHPIVRWIADTEGKILLLINILDRTSHQTINSNNLIYAGMDALSELRGGLNIPKNDIEINNAILSLKIVDIPFGESIEGGRLYYEFDNDDLGLEDIKINTLKDYFSLFLSGKSKNESINLGQLGQQYEYPLIDKTFDIDKDLYISLPLIQFGSFDGIIHIIFEKKDTHRFSSPTIQKLLIRQISSEYEGQLLDWDLVEGNMEKKSELPAQLEYLTSDAYEQSAKTNPIFKECNYRTYYLNTMPYFLKRVEYNDKVPETFKKEYRKRAIISILIDSYAHNISAHSLTILKWWFQQRAAIYDEKSLGEIIKDIDIKSDFPDWGPRLVNFFMERFPNVYREDEVTEGVKQDIARWVRRMERLRKEEKYLPIRDQFLPLAEQLYPMFKFLLEKGAFWSGVTRDQQFGGEIRTLHDVLWFDFINNPLYLGTIAYSEGITRLNINIRIYSGRKYEGGPNAFERKYTIDQDEAGNALSGEFARVDVGFLNPRSFTHDYVKKGADYEVLSKRLQECEIYLPGGVVGKHAFFTLIENEIRNVKHYPEEDLREMQENGLNLFIGIRPSTLTIDKQSKKAKDTKELFKIGIWIGHKTKLYNNDEHLITRRLQGTINDIITDAHQARLGGNYQDKICSAMLFNNTFISVQRQETPRDKAYYPWIRSAYSVGKIMEEGKEVEYDFEVRAKNLDTAIEEFKKQKSRIEKGYLKKYIHLWQGKKMHHLNDLSLIDKENISRFRMVTLKDPFWKKEIRSNGVIRILNESNGQLNWEQAYHQWLKIWMKNFDQKKIQYFKFVHDNTTVGHIIMDENDIKFLTQPDYEELSEDDKETYSNFSSTELKFTHGGKPSQIAGRLGVRRHGVLAQYYFDHLKSINDFDLAQIAKEKLYELIEVLQTKVCIFDKRIAERVEDKKIRGHLKEQLNIGIYEESIEKWEEIKAEGFENYHFIIMHLSFLETFKDEEGMRYGEKGIVRFLEKHLEGKLGDNCIFVVTTGRGREEWWRQLSSSKFMANSTFRSVEMLIQAVEEGRAKQDDIDLKHNLVKVLFGS